jgi:hypothetical protein
MIVTNGPGKIKGTGNSVGHWRFSAYSPVYNVRISPLRRQTGKGAVRQCTEQFATAGEGFL